MLRIAANLSMLFTEHEFLARFKAASDAGFKGVEYLFPYDFTVTEIKQQLEAHGLTQVLFNLPAGDWAKGSAASHAIPTEWKNSVLASTRPLSTQRFWVTPKSIAWLAFILREWA